ncbi:MAG: efflux RND transporter permease subunit, partial [Leptospirales bacterium]|nr:efflux RND transporter permease subunit [Leptospirales bacterium]
MIDRIVDFSVRHRFMVLAGFVVTLGFSVVLIKEMPLDALPDLSDTQVIVLTRWDRSPDLIEDQVTYPIVSSMLGAPGVKSIRGFSDFGYSYVYVIFDDSTDIYWARSRVTEYLARIDLPPGVKSVLGPDATGLGWIYQYVLRPREQMSKADLRSIQDWNVRFRLQTVKGVAEVASLGGFVKQFQVHVKPEALLRNRLTLMDVIRATSESNFETSGRLLETGDLEKMIRMRGYANSLRDLASSAVALHPDTARPVLLSDIASVQAGPEIRRGVADINGEGDAVSGTAIMRNGQNALRVIDQIKERIREIEPGLPGGIKFESVYDRSELIRAAIGTLSETLIKEIIVVSLVILLFLRHIPSATTAIITIPASVMLAFIPLYLSGATSNIMSLSGIAISIGVLVDGAIVQVENIYHKTQQWMVTKSNKTFDEVRIEALKEVTPSVFFSLLIIAVAFLPIFALVEQEGRLFHPLAYSKTFAMGIAAILAITLDPAVRMLYHRYEPFTFKPAWLASIASALLVGRYVSEDKDSLNVWLVRKYEPVCRAVLNSPKRFVLGTLILMTATVPVYFSLGSEFMPPFQEGTILYMPVTNPGKSIEEVRVSMQKQEGILAGFPEVQTVFGKAGRAETATDPAPLSMIETTITLKPQDQWRKKERWYSFLPGFLHGIFRPLWSDRISYEELVQEMDEKTRLEGWTNAFTMPIQNRIDMQTTGIRTVAGLKIFGPDLAVIESLGIEAEKILKNVSGTRSVYAERTASGYFLDYEWNREALASHGLTVESAARIVSAAVGGEIVSTAIDGRARYGIQVRYARDFRESKPDLNRILIPTPAGNQIPVSAVAKLVERSGPSMIRNEDGLLA